MQVRKIINGVVDTAEQAAVGLVGGATGALITNSPVAKMALITATGYGLFNAFGRKVNILLPDSLSADFMRVSNLKEACEGSFGDLTRSIFIAHIASFMFGALAYRFTRTDSSDLTGDDVAQNLCASFIGAYMAEVGLLVLYNTVSQYLQHQQLADDHSPEERRIPAPRYFSRA